MQQCFSATCSAKLADITHRHNRLHAQRRPQPLVHDCRSTNMDFDRSHSRIVEFLRQPFNTWATSVLYMTLCAALLSIVVFLATKYPAIIRRRPAQHNLYGPLTSQYVYPRTPYPRSLLIQVTSASDDGSSGEGPTTESDGTSRTRIARKPIFQWPIMIGSVERGHIAKRRRLSHSWTEPERLSNSKLD